MKKTSNYSLIMAIVVFLPIFLLSCSGKSEWIAPNPPPCTTCPPTTPAKPTTLTLSAQTGWWDEPLPISVTSDGNTVTENSTGNKVLNSVYTIPNAKGSATVGFTAKNVNDKGVSSDPLGNSIVASTVSQELTWLGYDKARQQDARFKMASDSSSFDGGVTWTSQATLDSNIYVYQKDGIRQTIKPNGSIFTASYQMVGNQLTLGVSNVWVIEVLNTTTLSVKKTLPGLIVKQTFIKVQ